MAKVVYIVALAVLIQVCHGNAVPPTYQNQECYSLQLTANNVPFEPHEGRLECLVGKYENGTEIWATICPAAWSAADTTVFVNTVCQLLGWNGGQQVPNTFGDGTKNYAIQNIMCPPNATDFFRDCYQYFAKTCGPQNEELAINCSGTGGKTIVKRKDVPLTPTYNYSNTVNNEKIIVSSNFKNLVANCTPDPNFSLYSGTANDESEYNGYVMYKNAAGTTGFICDETWNQRAAELACKAMCLFEDGSSTWPKPRPAVGAYSVPDPPNGTFVLSGITCENSNTNLLTCPRNGNQTCNIKSRRAGVVCRPKCCDGPPTGASVVCTGDSLVANFLGEMDPNNISPGTGFSKECITTATVSGNTTVTISFNASNGCNGSVTNDGQNITRHASFDYYWQTNGNIIQDYSSVRYDVECTMPTTYSVSDRYQPFTVHQNVSISVVSPLQTEIHFYSDCNFTTAMDSVGSIPEFEIGQPIQVGVSVGNLPPGFSLILESCSSSPVVPFTSYTQPHILIDRKCPVDNTLTMYNVNESTKGFQVKAYKFKDYPQVYFQCDVSVCKTGTSECNPNCYDYARNQGKRRRRSPSETRTLISSPVVFRSAGRFN